MRNLPFAISTPGPGELLIILLIILLLFWAGRIPEIARSLGEAVKEFKKASKDEPGQGKDDKKSS